MLFLLQEAGIIAVGAGDESRDVAISIGSVELLETWPRLRKWIVENRSGLLIRQQTAAAATSWQASGRRERDLWDQSRLTIASVISGGDGDIGLSDCVSREFLTASARRLRRTPRDILRRHPRAFAAAACALLVVIASVILGSISSSSGNRTAHQLAWSEQLAADAQEESASSPLIAEQLALAAYRYSPSEVTGALLYQIFGQPTNNPVAGTGLGILRISAASDAPFIAASSGNGKSGSFRIWTISNQARTVLDAAVSNVASVALAISPNGTSLAAGCDPAPDLCLWSLANPRHPVMEGVLQNEKTGDAAANGVTSVAFSPDGDLVAAANEAGETNIWSVRDPSHPRLMATLPNPMTTDVPLAGVAFSSRDSLLAETIQGGQTRLWSLQDVSRPVLIATIGTGFQSVQFSPDGTMLAAAGDNRVDLWTLGTPSRPQLVNIQNACATGSSGSVLDFETIAFSPDSDQIAYSGQDTTDSAATMCILNLSAANLASGSPTAASIPTSFNSLAVAYTDDGVLFSGGHDGLLRQWQAPLQQIDGLLPAEHGNGFDVSQDGRLLAGALTGPVEGHSFTVAGVGLWDVSTPSGPVLDSTIPVPAESVSFLTSQTLLICTSSGQIQLWNVSDPRAPRKGVSLGDAVIPDTADWSFDGEVTSNSTGTLVSVLGADGGLHLWQVNSAFNAYQLSVIPAKGAANGPAGILPAGHTALLVTEAGIQWIGIADPLRPVLGSFTRLPNADIGGGTAATASGLFLAGGLAANRKNETYDLIELDNGEVTSSVTLTRSASGVMAISADGTMVAAGSDDNRILTIWATADPSHPSILATIPIPHSDEVAFNASDTLMAAGGFGGSSSSVQVWSLRNPAAPVLMGSFTPPPTPEGTVLVQEELSPSGLLFVQSLSTVYLVSESSPGLTSQLCSFLRSPITPAQWQQYAPGIPYLNPCRPSRA